MIPTEPPPDPDGPLPQLLFVLTFVTGLVDAVSILKLGHVFVANMTGNVVFLGFAVAGAPGYSIAPSLIAIGGFFLGALLGGRIGTRMGGHRGRYLATCLLVNIVLIAAALGVGLVSRDVEVPCTQYVLIVLLAFAMGLQNAAARRLGVPDMTTTVLTLTITGLAADSKAAGGSSPRPGRRMMATLTMFAGALVGALLIFNVGVVAAIALTLALLAIDWVVAFRTRSSTQAWTAGKKAG
jgi:uncharacterized membrane protein YoaK (UPF0700 family)